MRLLFIWLFMFVCFSPARRVCTWTVLDRPFDSVSVFFYYYFYVNTKTSRHFSGAPVYISFRFLSCSKNFYYCIFNFVCLFFHCGLTKRKKTKTNLRSQRKHDVWSLDWGRHRFVKPNSTWLCRTFSFLSIESLVASSGCLPQTVTCDEKTQEDWSRFWRRWRRTEAATPRMASIGAVAIPLPLPQISWGEGEKERREGKYETLKLVGVAFSDGPMYKCLCSLSTFLWGFYFYFNQDSSLQCLLRGVGGSANKQRRVKSVRSCSGSLSLEIADIQPENLELTRSPPSSRSPQFFWSSLIFLFSPPCFTTLVPLLGLSIKSLNVWTLT